MPSLYVYTLGCKLNQLESEAVADAFRREGFTPLPEPGGADILVVNTCTVTSKAEQKARRVIRKLLRDHPRAPLVITGCYAQMERAALEKLETGEDRRLFVVPGDRKDALLDLPRVLSRTGSADFRSGIDAWTRSLPPSFSGPFRFVPDAFSFHSRSLVKIQDGCDSRCAYCRVSIARGPSVSLEADQILKILLSLEEKKTGEAVLTGVNISQYRSPGPGGKMLSLAGLLEYLLAGTKTIRIRLSSLEPEGIDGDIVRVIGNRRIRPHFHLSVQSGSPEILGKMGRRYGPGEIEEAVLRLRSVKDDPFLACDIITGFPGETPAEFDKTVKLCEKLRFAWIHAFPFSRRPGTEAWSRGGRVSEREAGGRVEILAGMARRQKQDYVKRWINRDVEAVAENGENSRFIRAMSDNYLKLLLPAGDENGKENIPGASFVCRITGGSCGVPGFDGTAVRRL
ncbi:MAG: tRNA (N(6)-L-threonylcarbamoyladenosine(37)-C(2))-methylthiotransferase MtaB [Treponema sp.]|jgi:threonylcarbamoyladenosine tRNA methylthiotransferase MtaB|nr:tRNA (N(6)-L-threonylcarbamoyladenosine(37)-C(2))-methylthiotransferase MtaB [Treponema sp.]